MILRPNRSAVGKAISDSSEAGTPSCFSGGRKMVKCTNSTLASARRRLRQPRSPGCGSPETRSTLSRSRTPSITTTALLSMSVSSPGTTGVSNSTTLGPPCSMRTGISTISPGLARQRGDRLAVAPRGNRDRPDRNRRRCRRLRREDIWSLPTTPKRGASTSSMRRSRSPSWPVISACSGALKPSASALAGMSWTRPSVTRIAAADAVGRHVFQRLRQRRKQQRAVGAGPDRNETRLDVGRVSAKASSSALRAASTCVMRAPRVWLSLRSSTTATTLFCASRCSRTSDGSASAASSNARASAAPSRALLPGVKREAENAERGDDAARAKAGQGSSGVKARVEFTHGAPHCPRALQQIAHMHLIGFVIAGQRVHHEIDAAAQRHFALARAARRQRIERLPALVLRPGAGEIVRGDDDRRDIVRRAHRARRVIGRAPAAAPRPMCRHWRSVRQSRRADRRSW